MKRWLSRDGKIEDLPILGTPEENAKYAELAEKLEMPEAVVALAVRRGITDAKDLDIFFSPVLRRLAPPSEWEGLEHAAQVLFAAIKEGREVLVWGDYDTDGITASAVCYEVLTHHKIPVTIHLPERLTEGYGVNADSLRSLLSDGKSRVLLTVDCGIGNTEAVEVARQAGATVVITDHHTPPTVLPKGDAVYDPALTPDCPCKELAGVGVAFFLMGRMNRLLSEISGQSPMDMRELLDLVSLGTVADLVKLTGQNRILVKNGLLKIKEAKRPGVSELKLVCGYDRAANISAGQMSFGMVPRINAAGRIGSPKIAFDLLVNPSGTEALPALAKQLDAMNTERRSEEDRILALAARQVEDMLGEDPDLAGIVAYGADWHAGVIGIVASRLVERYARPALVLCELSEDGILKGSGRSVPGFNLYEGLAECKDVLLQFGGHPMAAGLSLKKENLDAFRKCFNKTAQKILGDNVGVTTVMTDGILPFMLASDITFVKALSELEPFGVGNPEPVFCSLPLTVKSVRWLGAKKEHAVLYVAERESEITLSAKIWRVAEWKEFPLLKPGVRLRMLFTVGISAFDAYRGIDTIDLTVRDWQFL